MPLPLCECALANNNTMYCNDTKTMHSLLYVVVRGSKYRLIKVYEMAIKCSLKDIKNYGLQADPYTYKYNIYGMEIWKYHL